MNKEKIIRRRMKETTDHLRKGHIDRALELCDSVLKIDPMHEDAAQIRFRCLFSMRERFRLMSEADILVEKFPNSADSWMSRGLAYAENNRLDDAEESYRRCIALDPTNFRAIHNLGGLLILDRNVEEGIGLLEQAVAMEPEYQIGYATLVGAYYQVGRYEDAVRAGDQAPDALVEKQDLSTAYGESLYLTGNYSRARAVLSRVVEKVFLSSEMSSMLCPIVREGDGYDHRGDIPDVDPDRIAATYYRSFIKIDPAEKESPISESGLKDVLAMNPHHVYALSGLSSRYNLMKQRDEALVLINEAIALDPENPQIRRQKGFLLVEMDPAAAIEVFDDLLRCNPDDVKSGLGKAWALRASGKTEESSLVLQDLTGRDPTLLSRMMGGVGGGSPGGFTQGGGMSEHVGSDGKKRYYST